MSRQRRDRLSKALNFFGPFIGLLLVLALFALIPEVQGRFLRFANLKSVATQSDSENGWSPATHPAVSHVFTAARPRSCSRNP